MTATVEPDLGDLAQRLARLEERTPPVFGVSDERFWPQSPPPPAPDSWAGKLFVAQEKKRQQRLAEAERAAAEARAEREREEQARLARIAANRPLIAAIDAQLDDLWSRREALYVQYVAGLDAEIDDLNREREALQ